MRKHSILDKEPPTPKRSIREFAEKRNKILIWQKMGGLGDVFMQRMLFEDIHEVIPDAELHFACPPQHAEAAAFHPHISQVLNSKTVNPDEYLCHYDTCVLVADKYENQTAPNCQEHRVDIWAKKLGIKLKHHEMHLNLPPNVIEAGLAQLKPLRTPGKPVVALCPISRLRSKNLTKDQMQGLVRAYPGYSFVAFHTKPIPELEEVGVPTITGLTITEWMGSISACDYVVSVDTAAFHLAGGLKKPLLGVFAWTDGKVYGKWYDFILVQKHRDNGNWACGPCFKYWDCPKSTEKVKPCITHLKVEEIISGMGQMLEKWPAQP